MTRIPQEWSPCVSVVIPTFRRLELLQRCLSAVLAQRLPGRGFEVVVADDGHDDDTRDFVEALARDLPASIRLRYLRVHDGRGPATARNLGWRAARAELIAFTDDDTVPAADWLREGEQAMREHSDWAGACGRVEVPVAGAPTDHARMTQGLASAEFVTANAFVRRAALEAIDGFDERFKLAWREDSDLQFRLAAQVGPVGRIPLAVVRHPVRHASWGISLRQQRNAFFDALLYKKHPRLYRERIRRVPPWNYYVVVAATLLALAGALAGRPWLVALSTSTAAALVLAFAWQRLRHTSRAPRHVGEMLATSALIPFLSVYWRLRGAIHFRTLFW